jgi:hypothetical protein
MKYRNADERRTCFAMGERSNGVRMDIEANGNHGDAVSTSSSLKKRWSAVMEDPAPSTSTNSKQLTLPSVDSGFLAGLFDDVTKISVCKELQLGHLEQPDHNQKPALTKSNQAICDVQPNFYLPFPSARTVSPPIRHSVKDALEIIQEARDIVSSDRPAKKSRLALNVPSLNGLRAKQKCELPSYQFLKERSPAFQAQSNGLFHSAEAETSALHLHSTLCASTLNLEGVPRSSEETAAAVTAKRSESVNRRFGQLSFLDHAHDSHECPATLAANAIASLQGSAMGSSNPNPILSKTLTMNKFPLLPCAVSDSSCDTTSLSSAARPRSLAVQQPSNAAVISLASRANSSNSLFVEGDDADAFGWFVDMDENDDDVDPVASPAQNAHGLPPKCDSRGLLAFHASTAPKAKRDDAEIEWAQAADTVDSVLGDIF